MIKKEDIKKGLDEAYKMAGHNAYFGEGFKAGIQFSAVKIISIMKELPVMIPVEELFNKNGGHITKQEYGGVLIKYLCVELEEKLKAVYGVVI